MNPVNFAAPNMNEHAIKVAMAVPNLQKVEIIKHLINAHILRATEIGIICRSRWKIIPIKW